ncbi:unnamed protein product [Orchesella dallaii]|uniref:Uncharacterized protein n=1 Tax=Orchesella dallaii TaxID=48710 RepID=A0ABP1PP14_9HEXA
MASNVNVQFREVADRMDKAFQDVKGESDNVWKIILEKQDVVNKLFIEQIKVSDKFTQFYDLWRGSSHSENIASFHSFTEIDENAKRLEEQLNNFEMKLQRSAKTARELIREMRIHFGKLRTCLECIMAAQTVADLEQIEMQSLEWLKNVPDPEIEMMVDEWETLQLDAGASHCLQQLEQLLQSDNLQAQGN